MSGEDIPPFIRTGNQDGPRFGDPYRPTRPEEAPEKPGKAAVQTKRFWGFLGSAGASVVGILAASGVVSTGIVAPVIALIGSIVAYIGGVQAEEPITSLLPKRK